MNKKLTVKMIVCFMVAVMCIGFANSSFAHKLTKEEFAQKDPKEMAAYFVSNAKTIMEMRQRDGERADESFMKITAQVKTIMYDNFAPELAGPFFNIINSMIVDAYQNYPQMTSQSEREVIIQRFAEIWCIKICNMLGLE